MAFEKAAKEEDLWDGEKMGVTLHGRPVLLVRLFGVIQAYEDRCAHLGVKLSEGNLKNHCLTCKAHEWQYDAVTGAGINPASAKLKRLPVRMESGEIWVDIDV